MAISDSEYETIGRFFGEHLNKRDLRIDKLQTRIAALEVRPTLRFAGVWRKSKSYKMGDCVQHGGSMWIAVTDIKDARPNESPHWLLVVKSGQLTSGDAK